MATKLIVALAILSVVTGCGEEKASTVSRNRLAFLDQQQEPLLLRVVGEHMTSTPPGHGVNGPTFAGSRSDKYVGSGPALMDPYFGYHIRETNTFVEFWMGNGPPEEDDKIFMVVERSLDGKRRIIWPKRLVGTDPFEMMKQEWPKMYH
jgi:hypothetical protein